MPPVTKAGGRQFRKDVEFVAKDEDEQVAAGIVMVPDKADLQNDFAREETIREFSDQFETFVDAGEAGGGIMHAVFPDGWMELERNEVLDESEELGGETVEAGAWVQEWSIENSEFWGLIDDGILEGYSIGAIQVDWDGPYEQDEDVVADVDTSEVPDDEVVWELTDGIIREVSAVDIPAVPDAQILEAKADGEATKRLAQHLGNRDAFIEEALERGHTESQAERLWDVLNTAVEADGSDEPGKQSSLREAAKAFLSSLAGSPAPDEGSEGSESEVDESGDKHASGGDTPDEGSQTAAEDMSDDNDNETESEAKELAKENAEQIDELTDAVKSLTETIKTQNEETVQVQIGDEVKEIPESKAAELLGEDGEDAPEDPIKALKAEVEDLNERMDRMKRQGGLSDQVEASEAEGEENDSGLGGLGKALS